MAKRTALQCFWTVLKSIGRLGVVVAAIAATTTVVVVASILLTSWLGLPREYISVFILLGFVIGGGTFVGIIECREAR